MGTPVPSPDPEYGNDCTLCTPSLWPSGETPKYIYAYFEGIANCGISHHSAPNGLTFKLEQVPVLPCSWRHTGSAYYVAFNPDMISPNESLLQLQDHIGFSFFFNSGPPCPPEFTIYDNWMTSCILQYAGAGGTGMIFWTASMLELVQQFGLEAGVNLMHEISIHPDGDIVHKFCDIVNRVNVQIKITP